MLKLDIKHFLYRRLLPLSLLAAAGLLAGLVALQQHTEATPGGLSFQQLTIHPYASKAGYNSESINPHTGERLCQDTEFCPVGQTLTDMEIDSDGKLVAGYGDWTSNIDSFGVPEGRIGVVPYDTQTNTWGSITYAGSEALDSIRKFDGKLFTTTTDPSNKIASGQLQSSVSGYLTNQTGNWQFLSDSQRSVHVFDIQKINQDEYWLFGSTEWDGGSSGAATAWRSSDGGRSWTIAKQDGSTDQSNGFERYYWGAVFNGKVYMHARATDPATPLRIYDISSGTWQDGPLQFPCTATDTKRVVVFDNKLVCGTSSNLALFDGSTISTKNLPDGDRVEDFYIDNGKLYVLSSTNRIYQLDSLENSFEYLGSTSSMSENVTTLAIYDDYVYLGGGSGKIWRSTSTITDMPQTQPEIANISPASLPLDNTSKQVTISGADFGSNPQVALGDRSVSVQSSTNESIDITVDTSQFSAGKVNVTVTHENGQHASSQDAIEFTTSLTPTIQHVSLHSSSISGTVRLHVTGNEFLEPLASQGKQHLYWSIGLRARLVSLNGTAIPACMTTEAYAVLKNYYEPSTMSTKAPCYQLISYDVARNKITPLMSNTTFDIIVPKSSSASKQGTVKLLGGSYRSNQLSVSNIYSY